MNDSSRTGRIMIFTLLSRSYRAAQRQRGVTTLAITLLLLVILTVVVLFSTNVAFFEQRTTTNENRARLVEQAAEYALNLSGEYLKSQRRVIVSRNAANNGWLSTGPARRWVRCDSVSPMPASHPCMAERNAVRRNQMYFYQESNGNQLLPYSTMTGAISTVSTSADSFNVTTQVRALLCRVDTTAADPDCNVDASGNNIAITLLADVTMPGENASATIKETWAAYAESNPLSAVPLAAAGFVVGTGNVEIVAAPNAGGYGLPVSIWAANDVDIACAGGGSCASISTCHVGEFLKSTPEEQLKTTCVTTNNACGCPAPNAGSSDFLSGKVTPANLCVSNPALCENIDILDRDGGIGALPDVQFFPGTSSQDGVRLDRDDVEDDDSLFEWIFGVPYVVNNDGSTSVNQNCGDSGSENCAVYALVNEFNATVLADCSTLGPTSSGIFYITGTCNLPGQVGSPTNSVIVVVEMDARLNNTTLYGMLFVRSNDYLNTPATFRGQGNSTVVGSVVVEGNANITGNLTIIYDDAAVNAGGDELPRNIRFGKVPGSWLDSRIGL